ncbi:MAG: class I SAM-dependent methyltransferase [Burkholderiaceae bacterium]
MPDGAGAYWRAMSSSPTDQAIGPHSVDAAGCELCGAVATPITVLRGRDREHGVPGEWDLVRCAACELVRIEPMPAVEDIGGFYPDDEYYAHKTSDRTFRPVQVSAIKRFVLRHRHGYPGGCKGGARAALAGLLSRFVSAKYVLPWVGSGRLLDVGCGVGAALWRLRAFGWQVRGVELDDGAAAIGRQHGLDIVTGTLFDAALPDAAFDVVRLSHVLEHLPSPLAALREIHRILAPGGQLVMAVPNFDAAGRQQFGSCWFPLELPRHLFHFTPATMQRLLQKGGFRPLSMHTASSVEHHAKSIEQQRREAGDPTPLSRDQRRALGRRIGAQLRDDDRRMRGDILEVRAVREG